jgi:NAD(P)-dependent dehydrogenase (short-subunit alcohol dehydrogenase family)
MQFKDKKIVIIGGSSGIGFAIAKAAIHDGANVIIASRSAAKLAKAKAALNNAVETYQLDLLQEKSIKAFFEHVGPFDHLQLPGSEVRFGNIDSLSTEDAKYSFDSKFWGPYEAIKLARKFLSKSGSITLYSGAASQKPTKDSTILTALNAAVEALSRALAIALVPIRVNVISPGITMTPLFEDMGKEQVEKIFEAYKPSLLVERFATADEIAKTAIYLMSNDYVTGSLNLVDGGMSVT